MNLLNQKESKSNGKIETEIFQILEEAKISNENKKIAIEFFDFSKEMNLELLEHVTFQDMSKDYTVTYHAKKFFSKIKEKDNAYADRYILFLDALGFHTIGDMFSYDMSSEYEQRADSSLMKRLSHAFSIKYSPKIVEAKIITLLAKMLSESAYIVALDYKYYATTLLNIAKENPMSLILAAKYGYYRSYKNEKMKLYALGLAYTKPVEENSTAYDAEEIADIKDGIAMIIEQMENHTLAAKEEFRSTVSAAFMMMHHDKKIKEMLLEKIHKKEPAFLTAILKYAPNSYIQKNMDILLELLHLETSPKKVYQCVKAVLAEYGLENSNIVGKEIETKPEWLVYPLENCNIVGRENVVLAHIAEKYPEQYIEAMRSTENMPSRKAVVVGNYYEMMYQILETVNPDSIKTYQVDFDSEVLKLAAESEKKEAKKCKEKVFRYLCGENDVFTSEKEYEELDENNRVFYQTSDIVESCIRHNELFKKRYCALKAVQKPNVLRIMLTQEETKGVLSGTGELVDILVSEKIPIKYRFRTYEIIMEYYTEFYSEDKKIKFEMEIAKAMSVYGKEWDKEYASYCKKGGIFTRKAYLRYLEISNHKDGCKDKIFALCGDSSKEVRNLVSEIISKYKEYEEDVIDLLKAKKQAVRETAVDTLSIWGAKNYRDILLQAADVEKSAKLAEKICSVLDAVEIETEGAENPITLVENLHQGGRNKKILWLYETPNQAVHFTNEKEADEKYMQAILLCYANMSVLGMNKNAEMLAKTLNQRELEQYVSQIFSKWLERGAEAKQKWVLYFAAIHGGHDMIEKFLTCIKEWAEKSRGAIAGEAVKALALNGRAEALMHVDNMAHKFKHTQVKNAALQALDYAAEELGITSDELGDRIVPDLGFRENMERIFDYGKRKFKVYLTPALELEIFDEDGKKRKTLPAPSKKDEEETAKQSNTEFKQMKKQLKSVIAMQKLRLETALLADRRWTVEAWQKLFVKNPVMHSFAIGLIWAAYEEEQLVQTFRYMEDGSFNTSDEEEYELSANASIGLVHPIDLSEEELSAWKEQLSDYEIVQPIEQLERKVYHISEGEKSIFDLTRFKGRQINGMTLLGRMTKLGWYKGSVQDAGCFCTFYREDVVQRIKREDGSVQLIGNAVEFNFSGMYVAGEDEEVEIENVRFYTPGTVKRGSYEYDEADDEKAIKLDEVNPRYFSEIINQLEVVLKGTE